MSSNNGQAAYERDVQAEPLYHDGSHRPTWEELSEIARWSWNRNPTDRSRRLIEQYAINQRWLRGEIDQPTHDAGRWS